MKKSNIPEKYIRTRKSINISFYDSVQDLLDHIPKHLNLKDVYIEPSYEWCYDEQITKMTLTWEELIENKNYERDLEKYKRKIKK